MIEIRCKCAAHERRMGTGLVQSSTGESFVFHIDSCADCFLDQLPYKIEIESSINRVAQRDISFLNRCFDAPSNESMFQMAKGNFEYFVREIDVKGGL